MHGLENNQQRIKQPNADISRLTTVVLMGAESTGKSTLAAALAKHYKTAWAPEYLRLFVDNKGALPEESDVYAIAQGHLKLVARMGLRARRVLFVERISLPRVSTSASTLEHAHQTSRSPPWTIGQDYTCSQNLTFHGNLIPANERVQKSVYVHMHSCALKRKSMR